VVVHGCDFKVGIPVGITAGVVGELSYSFNCIVLLYLPPKWSIPKKKMAPRASVEGNPRSGAKLLNV